LGRQSLVTVDIRPYRAIFIDFRPFNLQLSMGQSGNKPWSYEQGFEARNLQSDLPTRAGQHEPDGLAVCVRKFAV